MKLARSLAMLAAATSGVLAQHEDCSEAVIASITAMHEYEHCNRDTGLAFSANDSTALTTELLAQICATPDCVALAADIVAMGVQECEVNGVHLLMDIVEPIEEACGSSSASGAGSVTAGSVEMEMEESDDDNDDSAEATAASSATSNSSSTSSNSTAATPTPSSTASGAPTATLAATALLLTGAAAFAL